MAASRTVPTLAPTTAIRPMSEQERADWYTNAYRNWGPHDCAGEPWVTDGMTTVDVPAGTVVTIRRARCSVNYSWRTRRNYAEVALPDGMVAYIPRASIGR